MTRDTSSVTEQNRRLAQLLSLSPKAGNSATDDRLVEVSDQVPVGRGLVFTRRIEPEQLLLTLPVGTLINVKSYSSFFHPDALPRSAGIATGSDKKSSGDQCLASAQLLSLLLARAQLELLSGSERTGSETTTKHRALQLFVQTLPTSFDTVPLTWSLHARPIGPDDGSKTATWKQRFFQGLLQALPPHSRALERKVRQRFERDWLDLCSLRDSNCDALAEPALLSSNPDRARSIVRAIDIDIFLWAWLCVNSRCVFLPLGLADHADNFTLAPMLDMANHTSDATFECKVRYAKDGGLELCAPSVEQAQSIDDTSVANTGEECFITYGPHSNEKLLSEYGFVLPPRLTLGRHPRDDDPCWRGNRYVDVLIDDLVERLFAKQGADGETKIELLQNRGYWGEFTIHPYPEPAHPSHRLIPALRLAALDLRSSTSAAAKVAKVKPQPGVKAGKKAPFHAQNALSDLDKWEETLTGYRDVVSEENERRARGILVELCAARRTETEAARRHLAAARGILEGHSNETEPGKGCEPGVDGCRLSLKFVQQLLDEEEMVLKLVTQAAHDQVEW